MATRRGALKLIGGGLLLAVAGGGAGWYVLNGPSEAARTAWREAGSQDEKRMRFLSFALLAPNPHNRQPWLVRLEEDNSLTLYCDLDRRLPATDPFDRQITLGCGAFLELLTLAAAQESYGTEIDLFPEGSSDISLDRRAIARVRFQPNKASPDPLFGFVRARVTNREVYTDRIPATPILAEAATAGSSFGMRLEASNDPALVAKLRKHVLSAFERESLTPATHRESVNLMRIGKAEVEKYRDGIVLEGQMMEGLRLAGVITREAMLDPNSSANTQALEMYRVKAASSPAFAWLRSPDNTRERQIDAGRAYARFTLKLAELGLSVHPWSHSLQEFPEMRDLYNEIHALIGEGDRLQMLVRIGYAPEVIHAPRRGLAAHILA